MVNNPIVIKENGSGGLSLLNATPIYRLSSSKNVLYLYASFSTANTIRVGFLLANGVSPEMRKVSPSSVSVDSIIESVDQEAGYNLWEYYIPSAVLNAVAAKNASDVIISFSESEIEDEADYLGTITSDMVDVDLDLDTEYPTVAVGNFANVWESPSNVMYSWLVTSITPTVWAKQSTVLNMKLVGTTGQLTLSVNASVNSDDEEIDVTVTDIVFDEITDLWTIVNALTGDVSALMEIADYDTDATVTKSVKFARNVRGDVGIINQLLDNTSNLVAWTGASFTIEDGFIKLVQRVSPSPDYVETGAVVGTSTEYTLFYEVNSLDAGTGLYLSSGTTSIFANTQLEATVGFHAIALTSQASITYNVVQFYVSGSLGEYVKFKAALVLGNYEDVSDKTIEDILDNATFGNYDLYESRPYADIDETITRVNQDVKDTASPEWVGATLESMTLYNANGNAIFTIDDEGVLRAIYSGVSHEIGENLFIRGDEVGTILNGDTVMYDGSIGASGKMNVVTITSANIATLIANTHYFLGVATQDFSGIQNRLNWYGGVSDLDTTSYTSNGTYPAGAGKEIYVDMVNGGLTYIRPDKPLPVIKVGIVVTYHATTGRILVRPHCSVALGNLHDVDLNGGVVAGDIVMRNAGNTKFEAFNITTALDNIEFSKTGWPVDANVAITISFVNGTRTFSLAKTIDDVDYWINNVKYTLSTTKTVVIDDVEGIWFIYLVGSTLTASQTVWDLRANDKCLVSALNWNATDKEAVTLAYEGHSYEMSGVDHYDSHYGIGTIHINGLAVSDSGADTLNVTAGKIADEDIEIQVIDDDTPTAYFEQPLTPLKSYKYYRDGANGDLRRADDSTSPFYLVGNIVQLNPYTTGSWGLTNLTLNKFGAYWVIYTSDIANPIKILLGQEEGLTLNAAQEANTLATLDLGSIPLQEIMIAYRVMVKRISASPYYSIEQIDNFLVDPVTGIPVNTPSSHGALDGLGDDDHTQYSLWTDLALTSAAALLGYSNGASGLTGATVQAVIDELVATNLPLKVDKDLSNDTTYPVATASGLADDLLSDVYIDDNGTPKKISLNEIYAGANTATGSFVASANYQANGLGSYKTAVNKYYDLTLDTNGDYYCNIKTLETDTIMWVKFPVITSNTNTLRVSSDNKVVYNNVIVNGGTVIAEALSGMLIKLGYDGSTLVADLESVLAKSLSYYKTTDSTHSVLSPINGTPQLIHSLGLSLNQPIDGSCTTLTAWTPTYSVDTLSSGVLVNTGNGDSDLSYTTNATGLSLNGVSNLFVKLRARVTNAVAVLLYLQVRDSVTGTIQNIQITTPTENKWYDIDLSGIIDVSGATNNLTIRALHTYADAATQSGKVMEVDFVMAIPLNNTPLNAYTASNINLRLPNYIEDITDIINPSFDSIGVQLFDKSQYTTVDYAYKARVKPSTNIAWNVSTQYKLYDIDSNEISTGTALTVATTADTAYIAFVGTIADKDTFMLNEGTSALTHQAYNSQTLTFTKEDGTDLHNRSVGTSVQDKIRKNQEDWVKDEYVGVALAVAIGAVINTTTIPLINTSGIFHAYDIVNHEDQYGAYGDTLTLTGTATVYYDYLTPLLANEILEATGSLIQESITTIIQGSNMSSDYDMEWALDIGASLGNVIDKQIYQQDEIDDLQSGKLDLSGGTMTGQLTMDHQISMDSNPIFGLPAPVVGSHAATKTYVDSEVAKRVKFTLVMSSGVAVSDATTKPSANVTLTSAETNFDALRLELKTSSTATHSQFIDITLSSSTDYRTCSLNQLLDETWDIVYKFKLKWDSSTTMTAYYGRKIIYGATYSNASENNIYIANIWGINY